MTVPKSWNGDVPNDQEDSVIGRIIGPNLTLSFDFSDMGYANHLIYSEEEYIKSGQWYNGQLIYADSAISYSDATKTFLPSTSLKSYKFSKADYIAKLTYKKKTIYLPVTIPDVIKNQNIDTDTTEKYIIKTIWPKIPGKGMTGIYIQSKISSLNLQINGQDLPKSQQDMALKAFKTIKIK
jgi:hypothetical protein